MLETEEVDVDYFTPSTSTSLSKIFNSSSKEDETLENSSLKYIPPLPPQAVPKPEEPKQQYLFADAVFAYEWINNSYEFRGRLGFAIFKIINVGIHKIVIYDSNKITLSSLTITDNTEIKVNENNSLSYYDNVTKFWSVSPSSLKLKELLDILTSLKVNLQFKNIENLENKALSTDNVDNSTTNKLNEDDKESDTDSSVNRKTKDSILKRMATMGQSVLPPSHTTAQTSDSSDTNESQMNLQKLRPRQKAVHKKIITEKKILETDKICEALERNVSPKLDTSYKMCKDLPNIVENQQIIPIRSCNIVEPVNMASEGTNMSLFISEQRVSNCELRVNMNRMTDKLDILLDKVKDLEIVDKSKMINNTSISQLQNEITHKLLNEYEKKIRRFEDFIKLKGFDCETLEHSPQSKTDITYPNLSDAKEKEMKQHTEQLCNEKDKEITQLKLELQLALNKVLELQNYERSLLQEISDLKDNSNQDNNVSDNINQKLDTAVNNPIQSNEITIKLKQIMNNTFQAISANFDNNEMYTGSKIKNIVGLVVKKTTIDSLKEF